MTQVEVAMAVRDGERVLGDCLASVQAQTLPPLRIHIAVGPSADRTAHLAAEAAARDPRVLIHDNPAGDRASGLNLALDSLDGATDAVAMVDAQARLADDYLATAAKVLETTGAAVVGGPMRPAAVGVVAAAIAAALRSPVGVGDSSFHFEGEARDVDSVYLGVYRRSVLDAVGNYDPTLLRTEDDDMNARIRAAGGRIRLDPAIRSTYLGRSTFGSLFTQYRGYGFWKVALAAKRRDAIRPRHLIPAVFVAGLVGAAIVSIVAWWPALPIALLAYVTVLLLGALHAGVQPMSRPLVPVALATMHLGYGLGTWMAVLTGRWRR